jgi:hypothetical protein
MILLRPEFVFDYSREKSRYVFEWQFTPVEVSTMSSLATTDQAAAAVATAPRVSLKDIEAAIAHRINFNAGELPSPLLPDDAESLDVLSICILVMKNGFTVIGKSAPASAENYDMQLGIQFAYEDAVRQLWPLMGYALRDRLEEEKA